MVGKTLSHYRILEELGRGGMGIVYKAEDTKLDRTVAIKVLPSAALASEDDRARFYREAKAAAQLHHPNIASVFEIDEAVPEGGDSAEPRPFIAMEFIEGETLFDTIKQGPLKLSDAVNVTVQIAEALKAAHAKDIVHRDIKSANVMMTPDGIAKVLDFGLAKTNQSTMLTRLGSTLGTMAYMSPEQARGQEVDGRTDLYSLGTMLYEMVSGRPPFSGDYEQAVVYSLLNEPPEPLTSVRTGVPMQLEWIVNKLLAKDADYRYQTAADLLADLKSVDLSGSGMSRRSMPAVAAAPSTETTSSRIPIWMWGVLAGVAMLAAGVAWVLKPTPVETERAVVRFDLELETNLNRTGRRSVAISPDGRTLAYVAMDGIRVRRLGSLAASSLVIPGNEGRELFFSPDSRWLGYEETENDWLMKVEVVGGGVPTRIAALPHGLSGASWSSTGDIFLGFGPNGMGWVASTGGVVDVFSEADSTGRRFHRPSLLPDGHTIVYSTTTESWDEADIFVRDLDTGDEHLVHSGGTDARYVNTGHLVYLWNSSLYAMPFDEAHGLPTGGPVPVAEEVSDAFPTTGSGHFDLSRDGTLIALRGGGTTSSRRLEWIFPDGSFEPVSPDLRDWTDPTISPDGSKIAVEVGANGDNDIWIVDATLGTPVRFTSNGSSYSPVWSPDGRRIAYSEIDFASPSGTLVLARDISDPTRIDTLDGGEIAFPNSWSSDGRFLAYISGAREASDIFVLDLENRQSAPFQDTDADTELAAFSPDGRWLAFTSDESGPPRVYVRLFPDGGNRVLVSEDLGWAPEWSTDGRQIYYGASSNYLRVSDFDPDTGVVQPSRQLPGPDGMLLFFGFSVHPDGRLLVVRSSSGGGDEAGTPENAVLDFVINFDAELRARTPGDS